jgi:hypothetical protein
VLAVKDRKASGDEEKLTDQVALEKIKDEFRLFGRRQALVDVQSLCDHLDSLVGPVVGEVIMNNLESRLGKEDTTRLREMNPRATVDELVKKLVEADLVTGMGVTKVDVPKDPTAQIKVEIRNPIVRGNSGAAKSFLFSYWCGALSLILEREIDVKTVDYDEKADVMRCELGVRAIET